MKRVTYISGQDFFDVDFPILKGLNKHYELIWIPIIREDGWYAKEDINFFSTANDIEVIPIVQKFKYRHPKMLFFYLSLLRTVKKTRPDIIYFEYFGVPLLHLFTPFFLPSKKIVFAIHDVQQHYKMDFGRMKALYFDYIMKAFSNFQVFSKSQLKLFQKKFPSKNVFVGSLCLKNFGSGEAVKAEGAKKHFLFFGIIRRNKGIELIIKAFNEISKKRSDFTITIAGDAKNWEIYDALIQNPNNYNLKIRKIETNEIPNLMMSADYLLLPYLDVTQSGVLLTAYNYNLPVIASNFPGFQEYISDGYNGYLVEPNVESLIKIIDKLLDQGINEYNTIKQNLSSFINKNINVSNIIADYVTFFESI